MDSGTYGTFDVIRCATLLGTSFRENPGIGKTG